MDIEKLYNLSNKKEDVHNIQNQPLLGANASKNNLSAQNFTTKANTAKHSKGEDLELQQLRPRQKDNISGVDSDLSNTELLNHSIIGIQDSNISSVEEEFKDQKKEFFDIDDKNIFQFAILCLIEGIPASLCAGDYFICSLICRLLLSSNEDINLVASTGYLHAYIDIFM
jgi:hypothetical protein